MDNETTAQPTSFSGFQSHIIETINMNEVVKHPKHYAERAGIECIKIAETFNFNLGNAIKYIWRAGLKDQSKHIEDLEKAKQYIEFEIERLRNTV